MPKLNTEYIVYKGEEVLVIGTLEECAKHQGVKKATIHFLASEANKRRVAARTGVHGVGRSKGKVAFKLDDFEDDYDMEGES